MRSILVFVLRFAVALAVVGALVDAVLFDIALTDLADGPSSSGYTVLLAAVRVAVSLAVPVTVASVCAVFLRHGPVRTHGFVLLLASGFTAGIALGMVATGSTLSTLHATEQPVDLNSMLLAIRAVGMQLRPIPILLAVAAVVVWTAPYTSRVLTPYIERALPAASARRKQQAAPTR